MSSFSKYEADMTVHFDHAGHVNVYALPDGTVVTILKLKAGWRWSKDVRPQVPTDSCQITHRGYCLQGKVHVTMDDGTSFTIHEGEVFYIGPGHDTSTDVDTVLLGFYVENPTENDTDDIPTGQSSEA